MRLERYAIEPIERGAVVDGNVERHEAVADALLRALRKTGSSTKQVAMALPSSSVITKRITLPADLKEDDYEVQVESEASQYIPFAIDEVNLDFQVLGPSANSEDSVDVLLAASRKEKVDDRVMVAELAGLKPVIIDVEPYAARISIDSIISQLPAGGEGLILAVFDIGQTATRLSVVYNGQTIFEREQPFGGSKLTQEIVRLYGLTVEEAELKKRTGDLPENYTKELLHPFVEAGATEGVIDKISEGKPAPTEEVVAEGLEAAKPVIELLCLAQRGLADRVAKEPQEFPLFPPYSDNIYQAVERKATKKLRDLLTIKDKQERDDATNAYLEQVMDGLIGKFAEDLGEADAEKEIRAAYSAVMKKIVRHMILTEHFRIDGRGVTDIRDLGVEVDLIPRAHGSSLFERGETQIMGVTTLDMLKMEQQMLFIAVKTEILAY